MTRPYIWMDDLGTWFTDEDFQKLDDCLKQDVIPLYTHPVKELTDEEILELWVAKNKLDGAQGIVDFARAILRKAQEK